VTSTGLPFLGEACFFEALVSFGVFLEFFGIFSPIVGTIDPVDDAHQSVSDYGECNYNVSYSAEDEFLA
jgi:hypothetical protein